MAPTTVKLKTMVCSLILVLATEVLGWGFLRAAFKPMVVLALIRLVQIGGIIGLVIFFEGGLQTIGWAPETWTTGLLKGARWSLGFALVAALAMGAIYLAGRNPILLLRSPMPRRAPDLARLLLVGGFVGPLAEELFLRGLLYTYFRRWGFLFALVASTAIFVPLHALNGLPVVQIVGSLVFAIAYEISRNLMVPITIHILGNLALFGLSLAC